MKSIKFFLFSSIFVFFSSPFANALTVKPLNLEQLTRLAPRIVQVTCEEKQVEFDEYESGRMVAYYTFKVDDWIKGGGSNRLTIKQLAQGTDTSGPVAARVYFGLPEYTVGESYLLFLAADSGNTGLTAPLGIHQGIFPMEKRDGKWVIPGLHTRKTLFKGMEEKLPAKHLTIRQLSSKESANDYETFKSVIDAILGK